MQIPWQTIPNERQIAFLFNKRVYKKPDGGDRMARCQHGIPYLLHRAILSLPVVDGIQTWKLFPTHPYPGVPVAFPPELRPVSFFSALKETYLGYTIRIFAEDS